MRKFLLVVMAVVFGFAAVGGTNNVTIVEVARKRIGVTVTYEPPYRKFAYPITGHYRWK